MKNRIIALVVGMVLLLCSSSLHSQITFERWYGGIYYDYAESVALTSDGGYIIAGSTNITNESNVYIIKTDSLGDTLWTRIFGGTELDAGRSVVQTSDNAYVVVGETGSFGPGGIAVYLIKMDEYGDTLWTKTYGESGNRGFSISQTSDGGYIVTGYAYGGYFVYLVKTDSLGDTLWTEKYGGDRQDRGYSVVQTSDGGYIIAGETQPVPVFFDVYLIKTDSLGDTLWIKTYGGSEDDRGFSVIRTSDGGYIVAGCTESFGAGNNDVWLLKIDSLGDTLWTRTYGSSGDDWAFSISSTSDGGYIVTGCTGSFGAGNNDVWLLKTDSLGDTLWTRTFGGTEHDGGSSVFQTSDGGYIIAGQTDSYGAGPDVYLIKTDSLGNVGIQEKQDERQRTRIKRITCSPNPFVTSTTIIIERASDHQNIRSSELTIYDASGRLVKSVTLATSTYQLGADLVPGVYFLKANIGEHSETQKLIKIR